MSELLAHRCFSVCIVHIAWNISLDWACIDGSGLGWYGVVHQWNSR